MAYLNGRMGRNPVGSMASGTSNAGVNVSVGASVNGTGAGGSAPVAVTLLAAIGFLVVFYWGTRRIQGLR